MSSFPKKLMRSIASCTLALAIVVSGVFSGVGTMTAKAAEDPVAAFVERMYTEVLGRPSEEEGKADWTSRLVNHTGDGASLAQGFIKSQEFVNRGVSNEDYLKILYKTFFDREPDEGGYNDWLGKLNKGASRDLVLSGFVDSIEFANLCVRFGISQGYMYGDGNVANPGIGLFVYRLYNTLLGRTPDGAGLLDWTEKIANNKISAANVATEQFILSLEFQERQKNMNNSEYLDVLYATFFNRGADEDGKAYWLQQLYWGAGRNDIVYGFAGAQEFVNLQTGYGLTITPVKEYVPVSQPKGYYWQNISEKTCTPEGKVIAVSDYQYNEQGDYTGYKKRSLYQNSKGEYVGDLQLTNEFIITYNSQGYLAKKEYNNYYFKEDGTIYLGNSSYDHYSGDASEKTTKHSTTSYNSEGQITSTFEEEYANGQPVKSSYKNYFNNEKLKSVLSSEEETVYNENGNEISNHYISYSYREKEDGSVEVYKSYERNSETTYDGQKKAVTNYINKDFDSDGQVTWESNRKTLYTYDGEKLLEEITTDVKNNTNTRRTHYEYDEKGKVVLVESYFWGYADGREDWLLEGWTETKYDDNGNPIEFISYDAKNFSKEGGQIVGKDVYRYAKINDRYRQTGCEYYYSRWVVSEENGNSWELYLSYGYDNVYDENGKLTWRINYTSDGNGGKKVKSKTKYLSYSFPGDAKLGQTCELRTMEEYDAEDKLVNYTLVTYEYRFSK